MLNLNDYTIFEQLCYFMGGIGWFVVYMLLIYRIRKTGFLEIPIFPIWAYLSWEFVWGFMFRTDMGEFWTYALKIYLPFSGYIGWLTLKLRSDHFRPIFNKYLPILAIFTFTIVTVVLVAFVPLIDDSAGITSANLLNLFMSISFILLLLRLHGRYGVEGVRKLSVSVGWLKLFAIISTTFFVLLHLPEKHWLHVESFVVVLIDALYLVMLYILRNLSNASTTINRCL